MQGRKWYERVLAHRANRSGGEKNITETALQSENTVRSGLIRSHDKHASSACLHLWIRPLDSVLSSSVCPSVGGVSCKYHVYFVSKFPVSLSVINLNGPIGLVQCFFVKFRPAWYHLFMLQHLHFILFSCSTCVHSSALPSTPPPVGPVTTHKKEKQKNGESVNVTL